MLHDPMSKDLLGLNRRDSSENEIYFKSEKLSLLLKWCKIICAHYDVKVYIIYFKLLLYADILMKNILHSIIF